MTLVHGSRCVTLDIRVMLMLHTQCFSRAYFNCYPFRGFSELNPGWHLHVGPWPYCVPGLDLWKTPHGDSTDFLIDNVLPTLASFRVWPPENTAWTGSLGIFMDTVDTLDLPCIVCYLAYIDYWRAPNMTGFTTWTFSLDTEDYHNARRV